MRIIYTLEIQVININLSRCYQVQNILVVPPHVHYNNSMKWTPSFSDISGEITEPWEVHRNHPQRAGGLDLGL